MQNQLPDSCIEWLDGGDTDPVEQAWVPGASESERVALARLGGVARHLLGDYDYSALHEELKRWLTEGPLPPRFVMEEVTGRFDIGADSALAELYGRLVSSSHRRNLGTFFTPAPEVELMLDMWDASQPIPKSVIDVGAGVGVFTASAARRWRNSKVIAIDINPVTLGLLAVRLFAKVADRRQFDHRVELVLGDFTEWIRESKHDKQGHRLILGNPPYTRSQLILGDDRTRLMEAARGLCGSRASLSTYITAISFLDLAPTDGLCLLLPAQWLETDYAANLRNELWRSSRRQLEIRLVDSNMFEDANVDAVALLIGLEEKSASMQVGRWRDNNPKQVDRLGRQPKSWRKLFDPAEKVRPRGMRERTLHELAVVRRGVATGANKFFLPTADVSVDFPAYAVRTVATKLVGLPDALRDDSAIDGVHLRKILACSAQDLEGSSQLREYVENGEADGAAASYLCRQRAAWYDLKSEIFIPDVIVGSMTRNLFKLVENEIGATITNNLFGFKWREGTSEAERRLILSWLRSEDGQESMRRAARRRGNGLYKLEPKALREILVPTIDDVDQPIGPR